MAPPSFVRSTTAASAAAPRPVAETNPTSGVKKWTALIAENRSRYCRGLDGKALPSSATARLGGKGGFEIGKQEVL